MGGRKLDGVDATDLLLRSFELLSSGLGDQPPPRHDLPVGIEPRRLIRVTLLVSLIDDGEAGSAEKR